mmetsp:Transcript_55/g.258  ORF Transcript_55/g.258 Transcript_55/m.258 type:complete len:243 (+) Transcript_55:129-857(+)
MQEIDQRNMGVHYNPPLWNPNPDQDTVHHDDDDDEENEDGDDEIECLSSIAEGLPEHFRKFTLMHSGSTKTMTSRKVSTMMTMEEPTDATESSTDFSLSEPNLEEQDGGILIRQVSHEEAEATTTTTPTPTPRHVHFGKISIREYASTAGDHPACQDGCPISLDWHHTTINDTNDDHDDDADDHNANEASMEYDVETFECKRFFVRQNPPPKLDAEQKRDRILETNPSSLTLTNLFWTTTTT